MSVASGTGGSMPSWWGKHPIYEDDQGFTRTVACDGQQSLLDRGTCANGCCDKYECPVCGEMITYEVPD